MRPPLDVGFDLEHATVVSALTHSLARVGDGELRILAGEDANRQVHSVSLALELASLIEHPGHCWVAAPHCHGKRSSWWRTFLDAYGAPIRWGAWGSSFISRPDEAPWINCQSYWRLMRGIWCQKKVTLVGCGNSLTPRHMTDAASVRWVEIPERDAYQQIDVIDGRVGHPDVAVLCAGPAGAILAHRLCRRGIHTVDLGHVGQFMPNL